MTDSYCIVLGRASCVFRSSFGLTGSRLTGAVISARSYLWLVGVSKTGDEEINGSYDFVTMLLEGTYFIPKAIYRNSGHLSR